MNLRQIVLDTETTGLDHRQGDRIVEIGCVEIADLVPTGRTYQVYLNPERSMSAGASKITGITDDQLKDCPLFADIAHEFLVFIEDAPLVIHNAAFDVGFLNAELTRLKKPSLNPKRIIDTLDLARKKFPGQKNNLDALCRRLGIDNTNRTLHGALLDAEILTEVYAELLGGRQRNLSLGDNDGGKPMGASALVAHTLATDLRSTGIQRPARPHTPTKEELEAHELFLAEHITNPIWKRETK